MLSAYGLTLRVVLAVALAAGLLMFLPEIGLAHMEGSDASLSEWFESLLAPDTGVPCCNMIDCQPVASRRGPEGWQAWRDGRWLTVPDDKVVTDTVNPVPSAVLCWSRTQGMTCFVPPPAGGRRSHGS